MNYHVRILKSRMPGTRKASLLQHHETTYHQMAHLSKDYPIHPYRKLLFTNAASRFVYTLPAESLETLLAAAAYTRSPAVGPPVHSHALE